MLDKFLLISSIWGIVLCGCNTQKEKRSFSETVRYIEFGHDTLSKVPIANTFNGLNLNYQVPDTSNLVYFYHPSTNFLSKVDLSRQKIIFHRKFNVDKEVLNDFSAMVVTGEKIIFFGDEKIFIFDLSGNLIKTQLINGYNQPYYLLVTQYTFMPIAKGNKVYIHAVPNIPKGSKNRSYYKKSVECILDITTLKIDTIPVNYLNEYSENYLGIAYNVDRILTPENKLVYAFQSSDSVTVYDPTTKTLENQKFASHQIHEFKHFNWEKVDRYSSQDRNDLYLTNPIYYDLGFDSKLGLYYRVFEPQIPLQDSAGNFNSYDMKKKSIVFYDKQFNYYGEGPLNFFGIHFDTEDGTVVLHMKNNFLYFLGIHVKG